ncbi:MFS transporter [Streptomyces prasinopilosus]|uniref:Major Facilitator Superfamily protein n=1 Tax=Streptomyces prasinopilosus TaxID=67344 RepID=A0A1G6M3C8_9ACTN|nr:MFS transporter [Streptomyces prasinopilosus]SDC49804.1 Major Facilitator Superfamily protein [Streptomyces prasinopilosus]
MFAPYRRLFAPPGTIAFTLAGFFGRLALAMYGVSTVMLVAAQRDSYSLAGAVAGVSLAATLITVPRISRLIDRYGQRKVAVPAAAVSALGSLALVLCAHNDAPVWTLFVTASLSTAPNAGGLVRARWAEIYHDDPKSLHVANSFEQVLDEICFIIGPIVTVALCTSVFPEAGRLVAGALTLGGTLLLVAQRSSEPPVQEPEPTVASPLRNRGLRIVLLTLLLTGTIFGSLEIVTLAYTEHLGHASTAGVVIGLQAVGSAIAGVLFGMVTPRGRMTTRLLVCLFGMGVLMLPLQLAGNLPALCLLMFVAGMANTPTMVTSMTMVQELVPRSQINEAMALAVTSILGGTSLGSAIAGQVVDRVDPVLGYWMAPGAAALALLVVGIGSRRIVTTAVTPSTPDVPKVVSTTEN